jgi:hypothetical protein
MRLDALELAGSIEFFSGRRNDVDVETRFTQKAKLATHKLQTKSRGSNMHYLWTLGCTLCSFRSRDHEGQE